MAFRTSINLTQSFFWGIAAYSSVFVAPALGLLPEIPGMEAAHLEGRQTWWLFTVFSTATGLWFIAFKPVAFKAIGGILLFMPHLTGAPQAEKHGFVNTDPEAVNALTNLWHEFIIQTSIANGLLWLIIALLSAYCITNYIHPLSSME